jgi:hypothetical protein
MKRVLPLLLLVILGCSDPFSSRESEPPVGDNGTFIQPVTPQIVLFNLENAYKEFIVTNYMMCLDSNFFFKYDFVIRQIDERDSGWYYSEELRLIESSFNSLLADSATLISLSLSPLIDQQDQAFDTTAILYRSYILIHINAISDSTADTTEYLGTSIFTLIENEQGLWSIIHWEDQHQNTNIPSWADYKNGYR